MQQVRRPGPRWLQSGAAALKRATSLSAVRAAYLLTVLLTAGTLCESDGVKPRTRQRLAETDDCNMADAPLSVGQHVRIVGLVGSAHLNGTPAIVLELDVPCAEGSAGDDGDRPDRLVRVELMSGPQRGDVVNCEPGNLVVVEPPNTLQSPWIPAGTALALGFWSPAVGVYSGLIFLASGAVMLCLSIFGINGSPARGEDGR